MAHSPKRPTKTSKPSGSLEHIPQTADLESASLEQALKTRLSAARWKSHLLSLGRKVFSKEEFEALLDEARRTNTNETNVDRFGSQSVTVLGRTYLSIHKDTLISPDKLSTQVDLSHFSSLQVEEICRILSQAYARSKGGHIGNINISKKYLQYSFSDTKSKTTTYHRNNIDQTLNRAVIASKKREILRNSSNSEAKRDTVFGIEKEEDKNVDQNVSEINTSQELSADSIRRALQIVALPDDAVEAAVAAALSTAFESSTNEVMLPAQLPEKIVRDEQTFFELPGYEPIPLYGEREDKNMDAIAFYERYWRPYEKAGLLTRADLKHFNESLISAIRYQCKRDKIDPDSVLPPTVSETVDAEIAATGLSHRDIRRYARHLDRRAAKAKEADGPA